MSRTAPLRKQSALPSMTTDHRCCGIICVEWTNGLRVHFCGFSAGHVATKQLVRWRMLCTQRLREAAFCKKHLHSGLHHRRRNGTCLQAASLQPQILASVGHTSFRAETRTGILMSFLSSWRPSGRGQAGRHPHVPIYPYMQDALCCFLGLQPGLMLSSVGPV